MRYQTVREKIQHNEIKRRDEEHYEKMQADDKDDTVIFRMMIVILFCLVVIGTYAIPSALDHWWYEQYEKPLEEVNIE